MVILVSGISFVGYIFIKVYGDGKGISITGLLGGMVSSTAVAFSFSKKSNDNASLSPNFAVGILLASTVMYPRVFIVVLILKSSMLNSLWLPLLIFTVTGFTVSRFMSRKFTNGKHEPIELNNPFRLKSAILFGVVFGIVIFAAKAGQVYLGSGGLYAASALAGLTSVDAIVLSLAGLAGGHISSDIAVKAVIIATISNNIVKAIISFVSGSDELKEYVFTGLGIITAVSIIYLLIMLI
jgi:uncharacterized membrane protein (DUF4010 family)